MKTKIEFVGYRDEENWKHYAFRVYINEVAFDYKVGIGHAVNRWQVKKPGQFNVKPIKPDNSVLCSVTDSWVKVPNIDEVLHCLFMDADCGSYSFNEFCDNMGLSNDSLKALDSYRACMDYTIKLRKALGKDYSIEKERIDALEL